MENAANGLSAALTAGDKSFAGEAGGPNTPDDDRLILPAAERGKG
jgi:hypothetical protein